MLSLRHPPALSVRRHPHSIPRIVTLLGLFLLLGLPPLLGQDVVLTAGTPEEVGMSPTILEAGVKLYRKAIEKGELVGAVLLVARDGKVVLHEALGWRHKGKGLPMEKNTMFRMASNTKPSVATGISMLVEEGKLSYDDPVREYIPSFDNYRAGFIQIKHLLTMSAGFNIAAGGKKREIRTKEDNE